MWIGVIDHCKRNACCAFDDKARVPIDKRRKPAERNTAITDVRSQNCVLGLNPVERFLQLRCFKPAADVKDAQDDQATNLVEVVEQQFLLA